MPVTLESIIDADAKYTDIDKDFADKILKLHSQHPLYGYKLQDKRGGDKNIHSWDIDSISEHETHLMESIMLERRKKHWAEKKGIKWMDGMPLTLSEIKTFFEHDDLSLFLNNLVKKNYLRLEKCKDLVNGKRQYKDNSELGYNICKGKLSFPISEILDPNDIAPTLTATDSCKLVFIIDDKYIRKVTDLELKRLFGFPDNYIVISDVNKYDLFGNTITPPVVIEILHLIFD